MSDQGSGWGRPETQHENPNSRSNSKTLLPHHSFRDDCIPELPMRDEESDHPAHDSVASDHVTDLADFGETLRDVRLRSEERRDIADERPERYSAERGSGIERPTEVTERVPLV
eukprot:565881-Rhodomonas_salina.2